MLTCAKSGKVCFGQLQSNRAVQHQHQAARISLLVAYLGESSALKSCVKLTRVLLPLVASFVDAILSQGAVHRAVRRKYALLMHCSDHVQ